jgi:hypothetical protein
MVRVEPSANPKKTFPTWIIHLRASLISPDASLVFVQAEMALERTFRDFLSASSLWLDLDSPPFDKLRINPSTLLRINSASASQV